MILPKFKELLDSIYLSDKGTEGSFSSAKKLYKVGKAKQPNLTREIVNEYLQSVQGYTRHARVLRRYPYRSYLTLFPHEYYQMDVIYVNLMKNITSQKVKNQPNFALMVCDMFSHVTFGELMTRKTGPATLAAFKKILNRTKRSPLLCQTDAGKEFLNAEMEAYCKSQGIKLYSSTTLNKAARIELINRDVKLLLNRMLSHYHSTNVSKYFPLALEIFNNSPSVGLPSKMTPYQAQKSSNLPKVQQYYLEKRANFAKKQLKIHPRPQFKVGDEVRRVEATTLGAQRGFRPRFSQQIYTIKAISKTAPWGFYLGLKKNGKPQFFYAAQLRRAHERSTDLPAISTIFSSREKVLSFLRNRKPKNVEIQYLTLIEGEEKPKYMNKAQIEGYKNGLAVLEAFQKNGDQN